MLLSELAITYLAAAAPFGVARFVEDRERGTRGAGSLAKSAAAALAWPLTAMRFVLRIVASRTSEAETVDESRAHDEQRVERVRRSTVNALREVEDLLLSACGPDCEAGRHALFAARASVERYAGTALACAPARGAAAQVRNARTPRAPSQTKEAKYVRHERFHQRLLRSPSQRRHRREARLAQGRDCALRGSAQALASQPGGARACHQQSTHDRRGVHMVRNVPRPLPPVRALRAHTRPRVLRRHVQKSSDGGRRALLGAVLPRDERRVLPRRSQVRRAARSKGGRPARVVLALLRLLLARHGRRVGHRHGRCGRRGRTYRRGRLRRRLCSPRRARGLPRLRHSSPTALTRWYD